MDNQNQNSEYIQALFAAIDRMIGYKVQTSTDFLKLSMAIHFRTGQSIGVSTLKRLYGYVTQKVEPRQHTLDVLANYVGYSDWHAFCKSVSSGKPQESSMVLSRSLLSSGLTVGSIIRITWQPDRICVCQYRGQNMFIVLRSENTRLIKNTTFQCSIIVAGDPLFIDHVCIGGTAEPCVYQMGSVNGVQFEMLTDV